MVFIGGSDRRSGGSDDGIFKYLLYSNQVSRNVSLFE